MRGGGFGVVRGALARGWRRGERSGHSCALGEGARFLSDCARPSTPTRVALCVARRCATATGDAAGKLQNSSVYGPVRSLSRSNARDISRAFGGKIARPSDERPTDQEGDLPLGIAWDPSRESDGAEVPRSRPAHGLKNCSNTGNNRINRLLFKGNRPDLSASR